MQELQGQKPRLPRPEEYKAVKREHDEVKRKRDEAVLIDRLNAASARKGTSIRKKFRRDK